MTVEAIAVDIDGTITDNTRKICISAIETLRKAEDKLIFMLCGMDYSEDTTDLYYYMLFHIIRYGIKHGCKTIDFGQTSEETKLKFGAALEERYFYAHHSNRIINFLVKHGRYLLEYRYAFPDFCVFKR